MTARELVLEGPSTHSPFGVSNEALKASAVDVSMIYWDGGSDVAEVRSDLPRKASRASGWFYAEMKRLYPGHAETLETLRLKNTDLSPDATMFSARVGGDHSDSPGGLIGTLKAVYADAKGWIPFFEGREGYRSPDYQESTYPILNLDTGQFDDVPITRDRIGPPMQIKEVSAVREDALPSIYLMFMVDLARRAQDPKFKLPSEIVLECPKERIATYARDHFSLISETPSADGLYGMRLRPWQLKELAAVHSHREVLKTFRNFGYALRDDLGNMRRLRDHRVRPFRRQRHEMYRKMRGVAR